MPPFLTSLDDLPSGARVCLYGVGEGCLHLVQKLQRLRPDVAVVCLIDDADKNVAIPIPVVRLDQLASFDHDMILVTSAYWVDICKKLQQHGCKAFMAVEASLLFEYLIFDDSELNRWQEEISQTSALLRDDGQRALYDLVVASRSRRPEYQQALCDYFHGHRSTMGREYLEYINIGQLHTIIEGGVFDGTDTADFARLLTKGGTIHGFDPNLNVASGFCAPEIRLYPMALWSSQKSLTFFPNGDNPPGARVIVNGEVREGVRLVSAISIDEFVAAQAIEKVDFIKLDVEGAELEVLQGASTTLQRHRPQLAICIYHTKEHLFQIPLFLDSILEDYGYYIGHYSPTFWDSVWYAVPREKDNHNLIR